MSTATATELYLYENIEQGLDISFARSLDDLRGADELLIRINSDGGSVTTGVAIYNSILRARARGQAIDTVVDGGAFSIAAVIAQAGATRYIARSALLMIHNPWVPNGGNADELRKNADLLEKVGGQLVDIFVARTGQPKSRINEWLRAETWFNAAEAVTANLADRISDDIYGLEVADILAKYRVPSKYRAALRAPVEKLLDDINVCGRIAKKSDSYSVYCSFRRQAVEAANKLFDTPGHTLEDVTHAAEVVEMLERCQDTHRRFD